MYQAREEQRDTQKLLCNLSHCFFKKNIPEIVRYANALIQPAIQRFSDIFEQCGKYPYFRLVDQT